MPRLVRMAVFLDSQAARPSSSFSYMIPSGESGIASSADTSLTPFLASSRLYIGASYSSREKRSIMYTSTMSLSPAFAIIRRNSGRSSVRPDMA
nr:hypothetical protein [Paratractidigestivibacter sp.]